MYSTNVTSPIKNGLLYFLFAIAPPPPGMPILFPCVCSRASNFGNMDTFHIRSYTPADRAACLRIFKSNQPKFFTVAEEADFVQWLDQMDGRIPMPPDDEAYYFVVEDAGRLIACGGWGIRAGTSHATLIWGMVDGARHGQGAGQALTAHRLGGFRAAHSGMDITIDTSQHTAAFYARFGFVTEKFTEDGYAPGLHRHDMRLSHHL